MKQPVKPPRTHDEYLAATGQASIVVRPFPKSFTRMTEEDFVALKLDKAEDDERAAAVHDAVGLHACAEYRRGIAVLQRVDTAARAEWGDTADPWDCPRRRARRPDTPGTRRVGNAAGAPPIALGPR